ncbi:DUF1214 domain-containing protein [Microbacterium saperdae]
MSAIPVNVLNFTRAETDLMFSRLGAGAGLGKWSHTRELDSLGDQPVIRQNRDTLYSFAVVDVRSDVTVTLPDTDDRYISVWVVNQDHYGPAILCDPGEHVLTRDLVGTDYATLIARILVDPNSTEDVTAVNRLQDGLTITGGGTGVFPLPTYDEPSQVHTRDVILELARGVSRYDHAFGTRTEVDPILHLLGTASGWGGLPAYEATYVSFDENLPVGEYRLRLKDVPVGAFWSVSLYNAAGYFEENPLGINSVNSVTATPDDDGGVTIRFGQFTAYPDGVANVLPIMPGWNYVLRLYRPHAAVLDGTWTAPRPEAF